MPGYAEPSSLRRSQSPTTRLRLLLRSGASGGRALLRAALGARAPTWSSFLLQRSCLASAITRRPETARRHWVFALRWSLGAGPPLPASSAFPDAAIPRSAVAAIPRGSAGGGRHPPDRVDGHDRRGVKRTAFDRQREPNRGVRPRQPPPTTVSMPLPADAHAGAISEARRPRSAWDRRCGLRPSAHRRAGVERAEPIARRCRARFGRSRGCLTQRFADELDLFTGVAEREAAQRGGALGRALRAL